MELDSLKTIWNDLGDQHVVLKDDEKIIHMLKQRSQSPVAAMKRNLLIEIIAAILLYGLAIWYFLAISARRYNEIAMLLGIVGVLCGIYYFRKYRLLQRMQCVTCEVRSNLQNQLTTLEKYVRFYFVSGVLLTPIAYFATGLIVLLNYPNPAVPLVFRDSPGYIVFVGIGLFITISGYFFNRWYIRKLYGQHITRLKGLLEQTNEF